MHLPATLRTSFGPRSLQRPPMVRVSLTPTELHTLVRAIERAAISAESDGRQSAADTLEWRAAALREVAR